MSDHDRRHFRKWDIAYITAFLALAATVYKMASHPYQWDQNTVDIAELTPRVSTLEKEYTDMNARNETQMTLIIRELDGIHRELRKRED